MLPCRNQGVAFSSKKLAQPTTGSLETQINKQHESQEQSLMSLIRLARKHLSIAAVSTLMFPVFAGPIKPHMPRQPRQMLESSPQPIQAFSQPPQVPHLSIHILSVSKASRSVARPPQSPTASPYPVASTTNGTGPVALFGQALTSTGMTDGQLPIPPVAWSAAATKTL
jgi:hypothetical protein